MTNDELLEEWPTQHIAGTIVVHRELPNPGVNTVWRESAEMPERGTAVEVDMGWVQDLLDAGLVTVIRTKTVYALTNEGLAVLRQREREEKIARLEAELAQLKGEG